MVNSSTNPIIMLMTFNSNEWKAVCEEFRGLARLKESVTFGDDGIGTKECWYLTTISDVDIYGTHISDQGPAEAQQYATIFNADGRIRAIIVVGVAFGIDSKDQKIGDILVAKEIWNYNPLRRNNDGSVKYSNAPKDTSANIVDKLFSIYQQRLNRGSSDRVHFGQYLSGAELIDFEPRRKELFSAASLGRDVIGGDMEAAGIAKVMSFGLKKIGV